MYVNCRTCDKRTIVEKPNKDKYLRALEVLLRVDILDHQTIKGVKQGRRK